MATVPGLSLKLNNDSQKTVHAGTLVFCRATLTDFVAFLKQNDTQHISLTLPASAVQSPPSDWHQQRSHLLTW